MISVFFNSQGYYIEGEGTEIARSFSPSIDASGRPMMEPLQHLYVVLACALKELRSIKTNGPDVFVYNDSRLIEEMGNETEVSCCVCGELKLVIRRKLLPYLPGVVLFRKKSAAYINEKVQYGKTTMLADVNRKCLMRMVDEMVQSIKENTTASKVTRVAGLKKAWFGKVND